MGYRVHIDALIVVLRQNGRMAAEWRNGRMAEWQELRNGIWNGGMTDGMAEWQNGRMAEWQNGIMEEWQEWQTEWLNGGQMAEWREWRMEWSNGGRMAEWLNGGMARMAEW